MDSSTSSPYPLLVQSSVFGFSMVPSEREQALASFSRKNPSSGGLKKLIESSIPPQHVGFPETDEDGRVLGSRASSRPPPDSLPIPTHPPPAELDGRSPFQPTGGSASSMSTALNVAVNQDDYNDSFLVLGGLAGKRSIQGLVASLVRGLHCGQAPEPLKEGCGGSYLFRDESGGPAAIVKPTDEEPLGPNNPKGYVGRGMGEPGLKPTVRVGEAALREVAAYLLDHGHFSKVPRTALCRTRHPVFHVADLTCLPGGGAGGAVKEASVQEFVDHDFDLSEHGTSSLPRRAVHRIGILDLRLFNTDRHAGNILVRRRRRPSAPAPHGGSDGDSEMVLIPIDHGYALPERLEPPYYEWLYWPQALMPFGPEELDFIRRLDPREDAALLRRELPGIRTGALRILEVATTVLKRGAEAGMSLSEIGVVFSRPFVGLDEEPSELERMCARAAARVQAAAAVGGATDDLTSSDMSDTDCGSDAASDAGLDDVADTIPEEEGEGEEDPEGGEGAAGKVAAWAALNAARSPGDRASLESITESDEAMLEALYINMEHVPPPSTDLPPPAAGAAPTPPLAMLPSPTSDNSAESESMRGPGSTRSGEAPQWRPHTPHMFKHSVSPGLPSGRFNLGAGAGADSDDGMYLPAATAPIAMGGRTASSNSRGAGRDLVLGSPGGAQGGDSDNSSSSASRGADPIMASSVAVGGLMRRASALARAAHNAARAPPRRGMSDVTEAAGAGAGAAEAGDSTQGPSGGAASGSGLVPRSPAARRPGQNQHGGRRHHTRHGGHGHGHRHRHRAYPPPVEVRLSPEDSVDLGAVPDAGWPLFMRLLGAEISEMIARRQEERARQNTQLGASCPAF